MLLISLIKRILENASEPMSAPDLEQFQAHLEANPIVFVRTSTPTRGR